MSNAEAVLARMEHLEQMSQFREPYISRYDKAIKSWYRRSVGTFPKNPAYFGRKVLRFIFKHLTPFNIELILRGRGPRRVLSFDEENHKFITKRYFQDLPLRYADKVAVYVTIFRR